MSDSNVIVDDTDTHITYGPNGGSWQILIGSANTYNGTVHQPTSQDVTLNFPFVGGREVSVQGTFVGNNNASESTTYPIFQVDSQYFLSCSPTPPQNGGQFICNLKLPTTTTTNRTLSMFGNPNAEMQQFHIDYIRYGSSSYLVATGNETVVFTKAPDTTTPGLSFQGDWQYKSIGGINDIKTAMYTATASSTATYRLAGNSFTWWSCCMPAGNQLTPPT